MTEPTKIVYVERAPVQPYRSSLGPGLSRAQSTILWVVALYLISPIDFLPFLPFDDVAVLILGLILALFFGGGD